MRLAISNIAWRKDEEDRARDLLQAMGVTGVEIAPPKIGTPPEDLPDEAILAYRQFWNQAGIEVVATQALLFGKPDLVLFGQEDKRRQLLQHLKRMIDLTSLLGGKTLVFGSPKNRLASHISEAEQLAIALPFFQELGAYAASRNTVFCIEPNPAIYGCDYVLATSEAIALADAVGQAGFGWHNDGAAIACAHDDLAYMAQRPQDVHHYHLSVPYLDPIDAPDYAVAHRQQIAALKQAGYNGWVSIEMRDSASPGDNLEQVKRCIGYARQLLASV